MTSSITAADPYRHKPILVTGADGFIGSHLTEALARADAEVTALAAYSSFEGAGWLDDVPSDLRSSLKIVRGDIRDPAFVFRLLEGQEIVFHLAALIAIPFSYQAPQSYVDTNLTGSLNVFEAARTHKPIRVIHTSTSETYGTAMTVPISESHPVRGQSPYAASKIGADMMAEAFARSFDLPIAILRPFNTFGPRQTERAIIPTVVRQALDNACDAIKVGDTSPQRDFSYVGNTVDAFLRIGCSPNVEYGSPYNCGSGEMHSIGEIVNKIQAFAGVRKPVDFDPARVRPARSEVMALQADWRRLEAATGWRPSVSLDEGLGLTIEYWRKRIDAGRVRTDSSYLV